MSCSFNTYDATQQTSYSSAFATPLTATSLQEPTLLHPRQTPIRCRSSRTPRPNVTGGAAPQFVYAIDQVSTKLSVPMSAVEPTQAMEDDGFVPGLCRLYLEGRCRQGQRCFQVHADPGVVQQLRQDALNTPSCCHTHGAPCNYEGFPLGLTITLGTGKEKEPPISAEDRIREESAANSCANSQGDMSFGRPGPTRETATSRPVIVPLASLCPTTCLWKLYKESGCMHLHAPIARICREHRKGLCRFGDECNFLHVCRQIPLPGMEDDQTHRTHSTILHPLQPCASGRNSAMPSSFSASMANHFQRSNGVASSLYCETAPFAAPGGGSYVGNSAASSFVGMRSAVMASVRSFSNLHDEAEPGYGPLLRPLASQPAAHPTQPPPPVMSSAHGNPPPSFNPGVAHGSMPQGVPQSHPQQSMPQAHTGSVIHSAHGSFCHNPYAEV